MTESTTPKTEEYTLSMADGSFRKLVVPYGARLTFGPECYLLRVYRDAGRKICIAAISGVQGYTAAGEVELTTEHPFNTSREICAGYPGQQRKAF